MYQLLLHNGAVSMRLLALLISSSLLFHAVRVAGLRYIVGGNMGWSPNVNYTNWTSDKHFYLGDWLFFLYDRNQMNVLEVNQTDYDTCNSDHPLINWTRGDGRDLIPLNVTKRYYIISGKGYCYGGMKLDIDVQNAPPPPAALASDSSRRTYKHAHIFVWPIVFSIGTMWESLLHVIW